MSRVLTMPGPLEGVTFRSTELPPPSNVYIGPEDALFITTYNSASGVRVDARGRFLRADGKSVPIEIQQVPNTDRTAKTSVLPLGEGFLLNIAVFLGSGTARRGQCYVVIGLCRGIDTSRLNHTIIAQGYVGSAVNQAWPGNRLEQPTEGCGYIRMVVGTNPAAGAELSETVPTGARWRIMSIRAFFTPSAAVANRRPRLFFFDGANQFYATAGNFANPSGSSNNYIFSPAGLSGDIGANVIMVPLPNDLFLFQGQFFQSSTLLLDVGDDWSSPFMQVEEWIEV